ncbi:MAG: hypothetical protein LBP51_00440 [Deferribacteraceae bacterium]|jgi:hypothetical protein|nr:hypothetical protein [Deferribacteraceae bacterium]
MEAVLSDKAVSAAWGYVINWIDNNYGWLKWAYNHFAWTTNMDFDDFKQQAAILGVKVYSKLADKGEVSDDVFCDKLTWSARSYCWASREQLRMKDIGLKGDDAFIAISLNVAESMDFDNIICEAVAVKANLTENALMPLERYEKIKAALLNLTATESEYISKYLGLGDAPKQNMKEIGIDAGVTESAVCQCIKKGGKKLSSQPLTPQTPLCSYVYKVNEMEFWDYKSIKTGEPFRSVTLVSEHLVYAIAKNIKLHGYDQSQPLIVWQEERTLIDGHTRLQALKLIDYPKRVPVVLMSFPDVRSVLLYMLNIQYSRRNVKDADIIRAAERIFKLFNLTDVEEKTRFLAEVYAELPVFKVKKVAALHEYATEEEKALIGKEKTTINELYNTLRTSIIGRNKKP